MVHLIFKSRNNFLFSGKFLFLLNSVTNFFIVKLLVTAFFLESNFLLLSGSFLNLALAEQFHMFLKKTFIHAFLLLLLGFAILLLSHLSVKLLPD